ncbi:MAG TPA: SagB family peptide dehydrogenase [Roseiflexaceae bacterium]|nr:SagB family peptide dehydrogenase [Roseiflexaceae bacterium]
MSPYVLSLRPDLTLHEDAALRRITLDWPGGELEIEPASPELGRVLRLLCGAGATEQQLAEAVPAWADPQGEAESELAHCLEALGDTGVLCAGAWSDGVPLATALPLTPAFRLPPAPPAEDQPFVLSRFAWCRRHEEQWVLESPLSHALIHLPGWQGAALLSELRRPQTCQNLCASIPGAAPEATRLFVGLLAGAGMLSPVDADGRAWEDQDPALVQWEFHDLLFHTRSRLGWHGRGAGATYRFLGRIDPAPAVKPVPQTGAIPLHRPDLAALIAHDRPFTAVLEGRRSVRTPGATPISARLLGEFLYRSARVKELWRHPSEPQELSRRPYPSGGSIYELEIYLVVERCQGLAAGLYHYDPQGHGLQRLSDGDPHTEELLDQAQESLDAARRPQILLVVAARHQRLAWKYETIAYALLLKHVGVLLQTMYLVATAMDLAPCAIGSGNSDLFAQAAGLDPCEIAVGEFALSGL